MHRLRWLRPLTLVIASTLAVAACGSDDSPSVDSAGGGGSTTTAASGPVTVGAFNFSESAILAHIYADALRAAGVRATVRANLGARDVVEPALEKGEVDLVPEYASTLLEFVNKGAGEASGDIDATLAKLRDRLSARGLEALAPSPANDQNAFAVTQETAERLHLQTISDLKGKAQSLVLGGPPECPTRPFCQPGLEKTYGLQFKSFKALDAGGPLTKTALEKGDIDLGLVFSSDGGVAAKKLKVLDDDKHLQNADNIVPIIRKAKVTATVRATLDKVSRLLTTADLVQLNKRADVDKEDPEALAAEWAKGHGFA